jgi:hypothetical protein
MIPSIKTLALVGGTLGFLMASAPARASLIGDVIDVQDIAIGDINFSEDPGSQVVADAALYQVGSFVAFPFSEFQVEVTGSQLIITLVDPDPQSPYTVHVAGVDDGITETVVGFGLFDLTAPGDITEAVVDPSSTLPYTSVFLSGGALYVDLQNINVDGAASTNYTLVIDVAVMPEPGTIGIITTGFAGLIALRRRRTA